MYENYKKLKTVSYKLIFLFLAQIVLISFSLHWMIKYYQETLIDEFGLYQIFLSLGGIGKISLFLSILLVCLIIYQLIIKKNCVRAIFYLNFLFTISLVLFVVQRLYQMVFMSYNMLIVIKTMVWVDLLYLSFVSCVGLVLGLLIFFIIEGVYRTEETEQATM